MERLFIKPKEAAEALCLGRSKIYELIADGTIPSVRIGKSIRVPVKELLEWAKRQSNGSQDESLCGPTIKLRNQ